MPDRGQLLGGTSTNAYAHTCMDGYSNSHTNIYAAAIYKHADDHAYADSYKYTAAFWLNSRHS